MRVSLNSKEKVAPVGRIQKLLWQCAFWIDPRDRYIFFSVILRSAHVQLMISWSQEVQDMNSNHRVGGSQTSIPPVEVGWR